MDNSKPKLVLLDIDGTLFDHLNYKKILRDKLSEELGARGEKFDVIFRDTYRQSVSEKGTFTPEHFLNLLLNKLGKVVDIDRLKEVVDQKEIIESFLFPDVSHFLEQASILVKLGILSKGFPDFQRLKLQTFSHLLEKDKIYIFTDKKSQAPKVALENTNFKVYFIDNDPDTLDTYKKQDSSWTTILIERYGPLDYNDVSDFKIGSLLEAIEIIEK